MHLMVCCPVASLNLCACALPAVLQHQVSELLLLLLLWLHVESERLSLLLHPVHCLLLHQRLLLFLQWLPTILQRAGPSEVAPSAQD
jgi:hypothetical protein